MKNRLLHRAKLQICKAYLTNAMEKYMSSIMNNIFSDLLSAEFVAKIDIMGLSQKNLSYAGINAALYMYPKYPDKYKVPVEYIEFDGAIPMQVIYVNLNQKKYDDDKSSGKFEVKGFDKNIMRLIFEVFREDAIYTLNKKIEEVQVSFSCYTNKEENVINTNPTIESNNLLMQCMLKIIEVLDPEIFNSREIHDLKLYAEIGNGSA